MVGLLTASHGQTRDQVSRSIPANVIDEVGFVAVVTVLPPTPFEESS
jgi:hypothetical protein